MSKIEYRNKAIAKYTPIIHLLSNEARVASRLRDMTERVTTSKGKYRGALPRKRAIGAGSRALPWGEYLLFPRDYRLLDIEYRKFCEFFTTL
jgi:hypothetical protein